LAHLHERIDFTVSIFIAQRGRVLFIHHKQLHRWLPVGGHIELDEHPEQAAVREAKEESGYEVELMGRRPPLAAEDGFLPLMAPLYMDIHRIQEPHWHIGMVYFARVKSGEMALNREEHHDIRWFSPEELDDPKWGLTPPLRFYARESLKYGG
jgi:8-oxo-dGTP pyrophosphatase MutT (NUDIX family)